MRVEAAAQVATVAARDAFDQIQQRIGIEQGSDARRLDRLSAEIARITREIADARAEDAAKRQILEANRARVEGQKAVDNTSQQFIDVRQKLNQTELQVALTEALQDERGSVPSRDPPRRRDQSDGGAQRRSGGIHDPQVLRGAR